MFAWAFFAHRRTGHPAVAAEAFDARRAGRFTSGERGSEIAYRIRKSVQRILSSAIRQGLAGRLCSACRRSLGKRETDNRLLRALKRPLNLEGRMVSRTV